MGLLPGQFWDTWDSYIEWSLDLGLPGLGILSFTEAVIQPIPPEALTLPMYLEAQGEPMELFLIWLIVTLTSVAGAVLGWWLGKVLGRNFAERFINRKHIVRLDNLIDRYGSAGIFIAALSPIPYKALAWIAGGDGQASIYHCRFVGKGTEIWNSRNSYRCLGGPITKPII